MPNTQRISEMTTAAVLNDSDMMELSQADETAQSGYSTKKTTIVSMANKIAKAVQFAELQTTSKNIVGAINEAAQSGGGGSDVEVTQILTEGTKIATITVDDVDNDIYGENTKEELEKLSTEKTVTGNPVMLETINGGMAKSCEVTMNPIQSGTGDPSPTNIRPISGRDSANVVVTGKNLLDDTNTAISGINMWFYGNDNIYKFLKAGTYTFSYEGNPNHNVSIYKKKDTDELNSTIVNRNHTSATFTIPEDGNYRFFAQVTTGISASDCSKPMIEIGSTVTTYEPYTAQTKTITFPSTVYGGTDEVVSGVGRETWSDKILLSSLTWQKYTASSVYGTLYYTDSLAPYVDTADQTKVYTCCDIFKSVDNLAHQGQAGGTNEQPDNSMRINAQKRLYVRCESCQTLEDFETLIATHDMIYIKATPTPFSTTPTPIPLNKGTNVISTDADSVEIKYSEMMDIDDVKALISEAIGTVLNTEF